MTTTTRVKICRADGCLNTLTGRQRMYCSHTCTARESARRKRGATPFTDRYANLDANDSLLRRGDWYDFLLTHKITDSVFEGIMSVQAAADELDMDRSLAIRTFAAIAVDRRIDEGLVPALTPVEKVRYLGLPDTDIPDIGTDEFDEFLADAVTGFVAFRDEYFESDEGRKYVTKPYHRTWIEATLHAIYTGDQQLILSPPRPIFFLNV